LTKRERKVIGINGDEQSNKDDSLLLLHSKKLLGNKDIKNINNHSTEIKIL